MFVIWDVYQSNWDMLDCVLMMKIKTIVHKLKNHTEKGKMNKHKYRNTDILNMVLDVQIQTKRFQSHAEKI